MIETNPFDCSIQSQVMSLLNEYTAGDSFNAACMITGYQLSPPIATMGIIDITYNKRIIKSSIFDIGATGSHERSVNITFTNLKLSYSGEYYVCSYTRSNNSFNFVEPSDVKSATTEVNIKSKLHHEIYDTLSLIVI